MTRCMYDSILMQPTLTEFCSWDNSPRQNGQTVSWPMHVSVMVEMAVCKLTVLVASNGATAIPYFEGRILCHMQHCKYASRVCYASTNSVVLLTCIQPLDQCRHSNRLLLVLSTGLAEENFNSQ